MVISDFFATVFALFGQLFALGTDLLLVLTNPDVSVIGRVASIISATLNAIPTIFSS